MPLFVMCNRSVESTPHAQQAENQIFESIPKADIIQNRIEKVRDDAVVAVLGVGVVLCVMAGALHQPKSLEPCNQLSIFARGAVGPFVNLVCVGTQAREDPNRPA